MGRNFLSDHSDVLETCLRISELLKQEQSTKYVWMNFGKPVYFHAHSLGSGAAGKVWFLSELASFTNRTDHLKDLAETSEALAKTALSLPSQNYGFLNGRSGTAWALIRASRVLGSDDVLRDAGRILKSSWIDFGQKAYVRNDFSTGLAGAAFVLLEYYKHSRDDWAKDAIGKYVNKIVSNSFSSSLGAAWSEHDADNYGFMYGVPGIAFVLTFIAKYFNDQTLLELARSAFNFCEEKVNAKREILIADTNQSIWMRDDVSLLLVCIALIELFPEKELDAKGRTLYADLRPVLLSKSGKASDVVLSRFICKYFDANCNDTSDAVGAQVENHPELLDGLAGNGCALLQLIDPTRRPFVFPLSWHEESKNETLEIYAGNRVATATKDLMAYVDQVEEVYALLLEERRWKKEHIRDTIGQYFKRSAEKEAARLISDVMDRYDSASERILNESVDGLYILSEDSLLISSKRDALCLDEGRIEFEGDLSNLTAFTETILVQYSDRTLFKFSTPGLEVIVFYQFIQPETIEGAVKSLVDRLCRLEERARDALFLMCEGENGEDLKQLLSSTIRNIIREQIALHTLIPV